MRIGSKGGAEARNDADGAVYRTEKAVERKSGSISTRTRAKIESALNVVKEALKGNDAPAIKKAGEKLNETWQRSRRNLQDGFSESTGEPGTSGGERGKTRDRGAPESTKTGDAPIIDAEVVDEEKIS